MSRKLDQLKNKLREMFQMDQADLDFGIYRIMNAKRDEVERFLEFDLLPTVRATLEKFQPTGFADKQKELEDAIKAAELAGFKSSDSPKVQKLQAELASAASIDQLEEEVYSHLATFFARYYQGGDFMSLRRYKEGVYALPYEGEEVKLHWANADQYYIKSAENFRTYAFKAGAEGDQRRVRFELIAAETEQGNNKAAADKERRFILFAAEPLALEGDELVIRFEYRPDADKRSQKDLNAQAVEALLTLPEGTPATNGIDGWLSWRDALASKQPTEKNPNRTTLERHLTDYTAKNSFDYFIHKNLGAFLRRELDFFIKNEIMFLDDIEEDSAPRVEQYLAKIKALRQIAHKIIDFLAQLEDFQKKLWLKKKLVLETNWLVTLDKVPVELYPAIIANDAQRAEWVRLFAIDEIKGDLAGAVGYREKLTEAFLKATPFLVLDTAFFDQGFKDALLSSFDNIDAEITGLLVHGENFQALNLLSPRYREQVECIYIDPPYNTGGDGFLYKDAYQHSSWLSLMADRLNVARTFMPDTGAIFISIDDTEEARLRALMENVFGEENYVANIIWQKKYAPQNDAKWLSDDHDYVLLAAKNKDVWRPRKLERTDGQNAAYKNHDNDPRGPWKTGDYTSNKSDKERPNGWYPIVNPSTGQEIWPKRTGVWRYTKEQHDKNILDNRVWWGKDGSNAVPAYKRFLDEVEGVVPRTIWLYEEVGHTQDAVRQMRALVPETSFTSPKSVGLVTRIAHIGNASIMLDFFAGSGTTGEAVIRRNADEEISTKFILVEVGEHFDSTLMPRIRRAIHATDWGDGKPKNRTGSSALIRYIRLESYEDALDNLALTRSVSQNALLDRPDAKDFREDYVLRYMMDVESRASLLNLARFEDPFNVTMTVTRNDETKQVTVDLVETFNYLLGLRVKTTERVRGILEVTGLSPDGERVLVLWRNVHQTDKDALDQWFDKRGYRSRDMEFDAIYVNGDNNIPNLRRTDETWKVRLIEEAFHELMFDVRDV